MYDDGTFYGVFILTRDRVTTILLARNGEDCRETEQEVMERLTKQGLTGFAIVSLTATRYRMFRPTLVKELL